MIVYLDENWKVTKDESEAVYVVVKRGDKGFVAKIVRPEEV
jgi:hypothetical protein